MKITVIMCTRNRADQLRRALESASALNVPDGLTWELLVVDNGSADHTRHVVQSFVGRLPIRWVSELNAGLSNARNKGISEATGDYICWTDDDVLIDPQWLSAYARAFARHPEAAYFGGPIELVFEGSIPKWLQDNRAALGPILAERQFGDVPLRFEPRIDLIPYGANFAVRASEQHAHRYDTNLGVSPALRRLGEETTLLAIIDHEGFSGWWVPDARVRHLIPAQRQTVEHLMEYQRAAGETAAYVAQHGPPNIVRRSMRLSSWIFRGAPVHLHILRNSHLALCRLLRPLGRPSAWLPQCLRYAFYDGAIEYWRNSSAIDPPPKS